MFYVVTPEIKKAMEEERKRKMTPRPMLKEIVHLGTKTAIAEVEKAEKWTAKRKQRKKKTK